VSTTTSSAERDRAEISSAIRSVFGERSTLAARYVDLLTTDGIERGLLGPREADRIWERHILNCAALASLIPVGARVVDLGSGAGLPGIPLAIARPDLTVVLLEPMRRRVDFLRDCLSVLALPGVTVQHGRAEEGIAELADIVVARAVASLDKLMRLSFELLVDNGALLALKGQAAAGECDQARRATGIEAELLTLPAAGRPATVIRVSRPARPRTTSRSRQAVRGLR
jgi:16S rRNA (guanine527-N7)-methyltransferase